MGKVKASKTKQKDQDKVKMMVVPWRNKAEFRVVYNGIYSDEVEPKRQAMEKMLTWQSRALSKLPIAIESSMALCRACISHLLAIEEGNFKDNYLKLVYEYSMAIIRFVNNVTELGQTKVHRMPLHRIADSFGIPSWIVEMRHNATHRIMPSLSELTAGADWILEWLRVDFWDAQYKIMETIKPRKNFNFEEDRESIDRAIEKYMADTFKVIRSGEKAVNCYSDLLRLVERHKSKMLSSIMRRGCFIPTPSQLEELGIDDEELMSSQQLRIPDVLGKLWGPLLNILHRTKLTSALVQLMVTMVTDKLNFQNFLLCSWLQKIIRSNASSVDFEERNLKPGKKKLYKYRRHIPYRLVLQKLLRRPSVYTQTLIRQLLPLQTPRVSQPTKKKILKLLDIVCGKLATSKCSDQSEPIHSVLDVDLQLRPAVSEDNAEEHKESLTPAQQFCQSPWVRDQDILNWDRIPVGALDLDSGKITLVDPETFPEEDPESREVQSSMGWMKCVGIPRGMEEGDPGVTQRVWTTEEMNAVKHAMGLI
eukprot:XP_011426925.1 PREDICTED: uncharacterized protein LOC105327942 [Crassostrea gigas]